MISNDKNSNIQRKILPNFYGILETKHYVFGRIRLKINILENAPEIKEYLLSQLNKINLIKKVEINTITGSITINFDNNKLEPMLLIVAILRILKLEDEINKKKTGIITKNSENILTIFNNLIYDKSKGLLDLKGSLALTLISTGIIKTRLNPILPNGITLLWWGYGLLLRGKY